MPWAFEPAANPSILRVHTTVELTSRTIETCPPAEAPSPFDAVLELPSIRSIDLHRYRARLNLHAGMGAEDVRAAVAEALARAWGPEAELPEEEPARAFEAPAWGPRVVAESLEMAGDHPVARALFRVEGVAEVIAETGVAHVRLGFLFRWADREAAVHDALADL